jgi:3'(2'), 5'-bisphosphate nucleotidase
MSSTTTSGARSEVIIAREAAPLPVSGELIEDVCRIAVEAGEIILRFYGRAIRVTSKAGNFPLSAADQASHEYLVSALEDLTPGRCVISEESKHHPSAGARGESYWLVDPLDGTKEFLRRTDEFTVNVALVEAGRPVLGVVVAPALGLAYVGSHVNGAWRRQGGSATPIRTRPADGARLAVVVSRDHAGPGVARLLSNMGGAEVKSMGSSLKFCLVAEGKADLYLRDLSTMEWDTAAAQCVVEAAGGLVCDASGRTLGYGKAGLTNPPIVTVGDPQFAWQSLLD